MPRSTEIENKKNRRFAIIEKTLNSFGFYKDEKQYQDYLEGKLAIVDYIRNDCEIIRVDFYPRENGRTIFSTKNINLNEECKYINAISTNFSLNI